MMDMNMPTTTAMAMATSTSTSDSMSGMSMSMEDMTMTFFEAFKTPLYSTKWTPTSEGEYAGTCIFLIALACILRLLLALKPILEERFWRNYPVYESDKQHGDVDPGMGAAVVRRDLVGRWRGWRAGASAARATYEVIIGGVGYLLMLAIMTMNVGYFLSVLGGIWLGTFLIGGLASSSATIHC
ncbi:low affinity copper transporter [Colletotrichum karsti]|uniref:Copper transport protein n=1 Tax=Colletotrichum karsti TaxID=1095194 RepID=A0A9P6I756_9PEZI|nr:low affinity copper transporter [Colletotrichum karsti]KAF9875226.1 low affinity copper transporter [Colletotrichum karsti]